jgi:hypothetical protein
VAVSTTAPWSAVLRVLADKIAPGGANTATSVARHIAGRAWTAYDVHAKAEGA